MVRLAFVAGRYHIHDMEEWTDQGIVLSARPHGENGAVVSLLTENHGRHAGYVHGARSSKLRAIVEPGTHVAVTWKARTNDQLGHFQIESNDTVAAYVLDDALKLSALLSACSLCDVALPEREGHPGLYYGLQALFQTLRDDVWGATYIAWELAFLRELGFGMDLTRCVGGGDVATLTYVSPKSGCAVSREQGEPYKDKLLLLPEFLKPKGGDRSIAGSDADIVTALKLTSYFLEHWVFAHNTHGLPEARSRFANLYARTVARTMESAA